MRNKLIMIFATLAFPIASFAHPHQGFYDLESSSSRGTCQASGHVEKLHISGIASNQPNFKITYHYKSVGGHPVPQKDYSCYFLNEHDFDCREAILPVDFNIIAGVDALVVFQSLMSGSFVDQKVTFEETGGINCSGTMCQMVGNWFVPPISFPCSTDESSVYKRR